MSADSLSSSDFEAAWAAHPDARFDYTLNRGLFVLYSLLLGGFWVFFGLTAASKGMDMALWVVAIIFGSVSVFVLYTVAYWRFFARSSGVILGEERLMWRSGPKAYQTPWSGIDFDTLGLTDIDLSARQYEHFLAVGQTKLFLFRPHVRMRDLELFMGRLLLALKEHGRLPKVSSPDPSSPTKRSPKRGRNASARRAKRRAT